MSIVIKEIRGKEYAYIANRQGRKVIHKYIGPYSDPSVAKMVESLKSENRIPEKFYYLFWDTDPKKIDLRKNARYIIERVLDMGGLDEARWLQKIYPTKSIIEICESSRKISQKSRNFWRLWFGYA